MVINPSKEQRSFTDVCHLLGKHTESPGASRISSHRIVGKYQCVQSAGGSVQRAVALHRDNRVSDDKVRADRGANVENAFVNAGPMEDVLGPAIAASGDNAKHVFHAQGDPGPVMGFHFRHGHDEIRTQNGSREP